MVVWKMPGLAANTGTFTVAGGAEPTVTATGTELAGTTSHGTWTVICCWPLTLATLKMGAAVPLNDTASDANRYGKGPNKLPGVTTP